MIGSPLSSPFGHLVLFASPPFRRSWISVPNIFAVGVLISILKELFPKEVNEQTFYGKGWINTLVRGVSDARCNWRAARIDIGAQCRACDIADVQTTRTRGPRGSPCCLPARTGDSRPWTSRVVTFVVCARASVPKANRRETNTTSPDRPLPSVFGPRRCARKSPVCTPGTATFSDSAGMW